MKPSEKAMQIVMAYTMKAQITFVVLIIIMIVFIHLFTGMDNVHNDFTSGYENEKFKVKRRFPKEFTTPIRTNKELDQLDLAYDFQ